MKYPSNIRLVVSHLIASVEVDQLKWYRIESQGKKKQPSMYLGLFHQRHQISFLCDGARHTDTTAVEELLQLLNASKMLSDTWPLKMILQSTHVNVCSSLSFSFKKKQSPLETEFIMSKSREYGVCKCMSKISI